MVSLDKLLSRTMIVVIVVLVCIPLYWPVAAQYEGVLFPVVQPVYDRGTALPLVTEETAAKCPECSLPYVDIYVQFDKIRSCEFKGLSWYDATNHRLKVVFDVEADYAPRSRPAGKQVAGPWRIHGVSTVKNTKAIVHHNCHPLWQTVTTFYP